MPKLIPFIFLFLPHFAFSAVNIPVVQAVLDNGLKIVVKADKRAPVFISQLWYKVGSSDESRPITGISHLLEHMMFKGTNAYPKGEFSKIIAQNGGDENAFTGKDYTAYYQKMHKSKLELAIKLEADRMHNLIFSNAELDKERQVVIEERRLRVEDVPNAKVYENLRLISFDPKGAYHSPVIGFQQDLERCKLEDLRTWYKKYYAPNNATLVVVGDVNPQAVIEHAKTYFGGYKPNPDIPLIRPSIPLKSNTKTLKIKAELPFYTLSFPVPSLKTANHEHKAYQLKMLAHILGNGLSKALVRNQQIASNISVDYHLYDQYDTLFILSFTPAKGVSNQAVLAAIKTQMAELKNKPHLLEDELARTKAQLEANFVFAQDQIFTQSYYLGMLSVVGLGVDKMFNYVDKMQEIEVKDISNITREYLNFANANTVELIPQRLK